MKEYIKQVLREGTLLTEITVNDAWQKFYSDANKFPALQGNVELFNKMNDLYDSNNGKKFNRGIFTWLYNLRKNGQLKDEDFYKAKDDIRIFDKFFNKIPKEKRDLNKIKSLSDLYNLIKDFKENEDDIATSNTDETRKIKEREIKKVFENNDWLISVPLTKRASCLIGKGTRWCTAADEYNNMFDNYNNQGPLYVLIHKAENNDKYQLHIESGQLMDAEDRPVDVGYFFDYIADGDVLDFFEEKEGFWCFVVKQYEHDADSYSYSELFHRALGICKEPELITNVLDRLRSSDHEDAIYTGFMYEDNPDNIDDYDLENLLENRHIDEESLERILEHLGDIGFVSDKPSVASYLKGKEFLKSHNLELQKDYKIDKGRIIRIKNINFDKEEPRFFVLLRRGNEKNEGVINVETLLNYLHQGQLFEHFIIKF